MGLSDFLDEDFTGEQDMEPPVSQQTTQPGDVVGLDQFIDDMTGDDDDADEISAAEQDQIFAELGLEAGNELMGEEIENGKEPISALTALLPTAHTTSSSTLGHSNSGD